MLDFVFEILLEILFWVIFLPLIMILSTPIILIKSIFGKKSYLNNLKADYSKVYHWWERN